VRQLYVIGIGAGDPEQVTMQAVKALRNVQVFVVADKGADKDDLAALRTEIVARYVPGGGYRIVEVADPERERGRVGTDQQYQDVVLDWHERRAARYEEVLLAELGPDDNIGFLVWGDPALYDSTIRIVERLHARGALDFGYTVIPAISSVQALAAAHRIVLNRIGEPIHITTGRRLRTGLPADQHNVVVMLDGDLVCRTFTDPGLEIYWGAYLGTPDEVLVAGPLVEVIGQIERIRAEARARKGWIMDTYLLRRPPVGSAGPDSGGPGSIAAPA
jgi:precorrin-6A synthase